MLTLDGKIWKEGKFWLVKVPALDIMTQGKTKDEAHEMIKDAIESHIRAEGFEVDVIPEDANTFILSVESPENIALLLGLMLKRLRAKNNLSLEEMRSRLGVKSRYNYAQYEKGDILPGFAQVSNFLEAMGLQVILNFNIAQSAATTKHLKARRHR